MKKNMFLNRRILISLLVALGATELSAKEPMSDLLNTLNKSSGIWSLRHICVYDEKNNHERYTNRDLQSAVLEYLNSICKCNSI
jgi:hypothetical protein